MDKLSELTIDNFHQKKTVICRRLIPVCFNRDNGNTLVFLVEDNAHPSCPGYPAMGIEYFNTLEEAKIEIEKTYKRLNYTPKYHNIDDVYGNKIRTEKPT